MGKTIKLNKCPDCGEPLHSDCWTVGRKLQQRCDCGWEGQPRIPEVQKIENTKIVHVGQFTGFHYEIFDKYGCYLTISRYYETEQEAINEIKKDMLNDNKYPEQSPCTAILWPDITIVKGTIFK